MHNRYRLLAGQCIVFVALAAVTGNLSLDWSWLSRQTKPETVDQFKQKPTEEPHASAKQVTLPQAKSEYAGVRPGTLPQVESAHGVQSTLPQTLPQTTASQIEGPKSWEEAAKEGPSFGVPATFQAKTVYGAKLTDPDKVIALTFDDGPWPKTTPEVLDILHKQDIKATFFWIGQNLELYSGIAQQVAAYGHAIGNHTWHHWYRSMDEATAKSEIDRTAGLIYKTTGLTTSLFRPPGGLLHNGVADYAKKQNYAVVMWSDDAYEFARNTSVEKLVENVLRRAKSGEIVLMHDGGGNHQKTVEALPQIIAGLKQRGYRFVTVPELLEMQEQQRLVVTSSAKSTSSKKSTVEKTHSVS